MLLHVLNGDATRVSLERSGVPGDITVWADVLHDGPVPEVPAARLAAIRADHLTRRFGDAEIVEREQERQDALDRYDRYEEVVFWFEHDLFDQLLLLRHLHWLSEIDHGSTKFSLICRGDYLGNRSPERLHDLFPTRQPITEEQIDAGRQGWNRFRAADPSGLVTWVDTGGAASLEFMAGALRRLFEEFPSTRDGLSRTERQGLQAIRDGATTLADAFVTSQRQEEAFFMGDWAFWDMMRRLAGGPGPLVSAAFPPADHPSGAEHVSLTDAGRRVLECKADLVAVNGIDRWIGGVHLTPSNCWRWDGLALAMLNSEF